VDFAVVVVAFAVVVVALAVVVVACTVLLVVAAVVVVDGAVPDVVSLVAGADVAVVETTLVVVSKETVVLLATAVVAEVALVPPLPQPATIKPRRTRASTIATSPNNRKPLQPIRIIPPVSCLLRPAGAARSLCTCAHTSWSINTLTGPEARQAESARRIAV